MPWDTCPSRIIEMNSTALGLVDGSSFSFMSRVFGWPSNLKLKTSFLITMLSFFDCWSACSLPPSWVEVTDQVPCRLSRSLAASSAAAVKVRADKPNARDNATRGFMRLTSAILRLALGLLPACSVYKQIFQHGHRSYSFPARNRLTSSSPGKPKECKMPVYLFGKKASESCG